MKRILAFLLLALLLPIVAACGGAPATAQQEAPTPTPLPPDPAFERPTYTVKRDAIDRLLEINGRVTPVDLTRLAFKREGRVNSVAFKRGDVVKQGDLIAELQQDEQIDELRQAEDSLVQAKRDLDNAKKAHDKKVKQAEIDLQQSKDDLALVLPGGENDPIRKAQQELEAAQREARDTGTAGSETKTGAEYSLLKATEGLQDQQTAYTDAYWDNDWAQRYGTDPKQPKTIDPVTGKEIPNKLSDEQKEAYQTALTQAERSLRDAERAVQAAQREVDKAREGEVSKNDEASQKIAEAQRKLNNLLQGNSNKDLIEAQRKVEASQLALEEARTESFNAELKAVENAQRALEKAGKKVDDGRIVAPQNGQLLALSISEGDNATAFEPAVEIADPTSLEVAAELGPEQMKQLSEGEPAQLTLLSRPDVILPSVIRQMPAPYGSGGSGTVEERDRTTRFKLLDLKGQQVEAGVTIVKIKIVLEHKDNVLWLPPDAIRAFEGRRFVVVRQGERERRVTIKTGIETEDKVEIVDGLKAGDTVVGQ